MTDWTPLSKGNAEEASERAARESRHQVLIELLGAYADRELPPETASQIEAHLVGCARCRSELAVHQAVQRRLGDAPPIAAPPALRERITAAIAAMPVADKPAPVATRPGWSTAKRAVIVVIVLAALGLGGTAIAVMLRTPSVVTSSNVARLSVSPASVPLLRDALVNYRQVTAGDLPGRARDLDLVRGAVAFPIEPLRAPAVRLLAAWTTDLSGEPAAVLAYRWDDRIVLQYLVPESRFFRHPAIRAAVSANHVLATADGAQGIVAWPTQEAGAVLIGDVSPDRLARLVTRPTGRDGAP